MQPKLTEFYPVFTVLSFLPLKIRRALLFLFRKFRKTKQVPLTFVAATFKSFFSVAKTYAGLAGRKLYAGDIKYLFWSFSLFLSFFHISSYQYKKCADRNQRTKTQIPVVAKQTIYRFWVYYYTLHRVRNLHFIKLTTIKSIFKKGYKYP